MSPNVMNLEKPTITSATSTVGEPLVPTGKSPSYSKQEFESWQGEDYGAAKLVVGIIGSVVTAGLALYVFIACLVAMGGH